MGLANWEVSELWRKDSKCWSDDKDPNFFFVDGSEATNGRNGISMETIENERKKYCNDCPVIQDCLNWAMSTSQEFGIYGGTTASDRKRIRRRLQARKRSELNQPEPKRAKAKEIVVIEPVEPYIPKCDRQEQAS